MSKNLIFLGTKLRNCIDISKCIYNYTSIKNAHSSIFGRLRIYDIEKITTFASTLRIRGNAEVRPPNVKGTVMQTV